MANFEFLSSSEYQLNHQKKKSEYQFKSVFILQLLHPTVLYHLPPNKKVQQIHTCIFASSHSQSGSSPIELELR